MKSLKTKAVVLNADGSLFYREEHEWPKLDDLGSAALQAWLDEGVAYTQKRPDKNADKANLTATLSATIDGVAQPDIHLTNVSYKEVLEVEAIAHKHGAKLMQMGRDMGKQKHGHK